MFGAAGAAVKLAEERGVGLDKLTLTDLQSLHGSFQDDVAQLWSYEHRCVLSCDFPWFSGCLLIKDATVVRVLPSFCSAESRNSVGGTSKARVLEQIATIRDR
jgi:argininosuccinate lyase